MGFGHLALTESRALKWITMGAKSSFLHYFWKSWPLDPVVGQHPLSTSSSTLTQTHSVCPSSFGWSKAVETASSSWAAPCQGQSEAETTAVPMPLLGSFGTFLNRVNTCTAAHHSFSELISLMIKYLLSVKTFKFQMLTGMTWAHCAFLKRGIEPHFPVSSSQLLSPVVAFHIT